MCEHRGQHHERQQVLIPGIPASTTGRAPETGLGAADAAAPKTQ